MAGQTNLRLISIFFALGLGVLLVVAVSAEEKKEKKHPAIKIGMVSSIFRDMPDCLARAAMKPFQALMESQTGLRGKIVPGGDAYELGAKLTTNEIQLGVFHGFEFAWAQQRFPQLRPLMIAVNQKRHLYACLVVKKDCPAADLAGLTGKSLAMSQQTREHCRLFLDRRCQSLAKNAAQVFSRITNPCNSEEALQAVAAGRVDAALVDAISLACYKMLYPGPAARLKVLEKSEVFPAAVVAYHAGAVNKQTLHRFKSGMLNAAKTAYGRQMLLMGRMTGFEPVPKDYKKLLAQVVRTYPPPKTFAVSAKNQSASP
jgi:ABC-type phosphate/phosphonate transport system substrate-binding protein